MSPMEALTVDGQLESVTLITEYVAEAARAAEVHGRVAYYLCLAVDEIATNIIVHGYKHQVGTLTVEAQMDEGELRIVLEDTGPSYDPRQAPLPDLQRPLEERQPGGLGIFLALRSVDDFRYERVHGRNRSIFSVQRGAV